MHGFWVELPPLNDEVSCIAHALNFRINLRGDNGNLGASANQPLSNGRIEVAQMAPAPMETEVMDEEMQIVNENNVAVERLLPLGSNPRNFVNFSSPRFKLQ